METNSEKPNVIVLEPWQGRLIEEYNELHERIVKLAKFIKDTDGKISSLSQYELDNLLWQFDAMALYVGCLGRRINFYCPDVEIDQSYGYTTFVAKAVQSTIDRFFDKCKLTDQLNQMVTRIKDNKN